jgi:hypothetical protein
MLRAIGIYTIDTSPTTCQRFTPHSSAPKPQLFNLFNSNPLASIEAHTFPQVRLSDLDAPGILHYQYQSEHHYLRQVTGKPFLMVICSKNRLDSKEAAYLMINIQHAFQYPDNSGVTLDKMIINPLGYIAKDHLVTATQQNVDELKQIALSNIHSLIERGERIDNLTSNASTLSDLTSTFKRRTEEQNSWCGGSYCSI